MQTLFRNPLAGPYVLGLSSGASLGVAAVILGAAFLPQSCHYNAIFLRNRIGFKPWKF
jgi:ABC-type Fe3+-siderophore transport system permease subunit